MGRGLQRLSAELIDQIIDQLDDRDIFTIKSCSLVSHALARRARERLFRNIRRKVVSDEDEPALEECLRSSAARRCRGAAHPSGGGEAAREAEHREEATKSSDERRFVCRPGSTPVASPVAVACPSLPCAADLVRNLELCGDYLRPAPCVTTSTLRRILSYVPRLRSFQLHNFSLVPDHKSECEEQTSISTSKKTPFTAIALEELDLQLDFRTTRGLISVLRLFSRTTCLRLRQIVSSEAADFPQTQDEVETEIDRVAPEHSHSLDLRVGQLELYLWQIGPVCLALLRRAAYASGVAVSSVRIKCDCGQRNLELLGAFFNNERISKSIKHVAMVYPFYVPGPLPDFDVLRLSALSALSTLTVEGFYLGEIHSPQPPFTLIADLLSSWSALPVDTPFQLTLDIVFARRLTEHLGPGQGLPALKGRGTAVDVAHFLANSPDVHWEEIERVLSRKHFPKVMFMLRSQAGPLESEERERLVDTVHGKLRGLHGRCEVMVEVSEP